MFGSKDKKVGFRAAGDLLQSLQNRAHRGQDISEVARKSLEHYFELLDLGRRILALRFSMAELFLILEVCKDIQAEPGTMLFVMHEIEKRAREGLDKKWGVDGLMLSVRLRELPPFTIWALMDAAERFWLRPDNLLDVQGLMSIGLMPSDGS